MNNDDDDDDDDNNNHNSNASRLMMSLSTCGAKSSFSRAFCIVHPYTACCKITVSCSAVQTALLGDREEVMILHTHSTTTVLLLADGQTSLLQVIG